jgi:glycosyltransferase involved in cell wall biosynthesis
MKVSVAMTSRNGEKYIEEQLNSILMQSWPPDEIVICDDFSSDGTMQILEEIAKQHPSVILIQNTKVIGVSRNFTRSIKKASGDIIFLSDQDDWWYPKKIENVLSYFKLNPQIQVIINNQEIVDKNLKRSGRTKLSNIIKSGLNPRIDFCTGSCTAITKNWADFCLPYNYEKIEYDVWLNRVAEYFSTRMILYDVLQLFRRHENNASSWVISNAYTMHKFLRYIKNFKKSPNENWNKELFVLTEILEKFQVGQKFIDSKKLYFIKRNIEKEIKYAAFRVSLLNLNYIERLSKIFILAFSGFYFSHASFKNFLKDITFFNH